MAHTQVPAAVADFWLRNGLPHMTEKDAATTLVTPTLNYFKNGSGLFVPVSPTDRMPVDATLTGSSVTLPTSLTSEGTVGQPAPSKAMALGLMTGSSALAYMAGLSAITDGTIASGVPGAGTLGFNGASWDRVRVPNVYKNVNVAIAAGGEVVLWTPATGKKFRLMGAIIAPSVAVGGGLVLRDGALGNSILSIGAPASTNATYLLGQGRLSVAANNALVAFCSTAVNIVGIVWGTEE